MMFSRAPAEKKDTDNTAHPIIHSYPRILLGLFQPKDYGYACGQEWVQDADILDIHEAATRLTTDQQIGKCFDRYIRDYREDEGCNPVLMFPTMDNAHEYFSREITEYFADIQEGHFYYRSYEDISKEMNNEVFPSSTMVPNHLLRSFEGGWTRAVQDFYKKYLLTLEDAYWNSTVPLWDNLLQN
jgi:hypothetical protein